MNHDGARRIAHIENELIVVVLACAFAGVVLSITAWLLRRAIRRSAATAPLEAGLAREMVPLGVALRRPGASSAFASSKTSRS